MNKAMAEDDGGGKVGPAEQAGTFKDDENADNGGGGGKLSPGETVSTSQRCPCEDYRAIVQEAARLLQLGDGMDLSGYIGQDLPKETVPEKPSVSPTKRAFEDRTHIPLARPAQIDAPMRERKRKKRTSSLIKVMSPKVVYSKAFGLRDMMQGVSLSIVAGLVSLSQLKTVDTQRVWPSQGSEIIGLHPLVDANSLRWAKVQQMRIDYMEPPLKVDKYNYILLQQIGRGKNGPVFLGVDYYGRACALKFYAGDSDSQTGYSAEERQDMEQKEFKKLGEKVREEAKLWTRLQPEYSDYVREMKLNEQNVLRMPVFAPVPTASRLAVLTAVAAMLTKLYNDGFVYPEEVRWQHIACRRKECEEDGSDLKLVLLDMESLVPVTTITEDAATHVKNHIEKLKARRESDPAGSVTGTLLPHIAYNTGISPVLDGIM
jgi:hypothetical protein